MHRSYSYLSKFVMGNQPYISKLKRTFHGEIVDFAILRIYSGMWSNVCESEYTEEMLGIKTEKGQGETWRELNF